MTNYFESNGSFVFHPGYYVGEIVEESGLTQQDFARRLGTTPKNLSKLINAEQRLSVEMAMRLSKMLGTTIQYWLNLQNAYDITIAQLAADAELETEKQILEILGCDYFDANFDLSCSSDKTEEQVASIRRFLGLASLTVLRNQNLSVSFRSAKEPPCEESTVKANAMVQIAMNEALAVASPAFSRKKLEEAVAYLVTQTDNHDGFLSLIHERLLGAGVVLAILPYFQGSKTNGATKRIGKSIVLMVNDRRMHADSFWFTLLHEVGHIINGDLGISFEGDVNDIEHAADEYARNILISPESYRSFVDHGDFSVSSVCHFASQIHRDPDIVVGRLLNDGLVSASNSELMSLRSEYVVLPCVR